MPIEFKEKCGICSAPISCWGYTLDEELDPDKDCTGVQCDMGAARGCFRHYCEGCFKKHKCSAYTGSDYIEKN